MIIRQASINDFQKVIHISQTTIRTIYPRYYPSGAVQYFCDHHSDDRIHSDIVSGIVYLLENDTDVVGTVTKSAVALMPDADEELPYEGAKRMLLVDNVEDRDFLRELIEAIYEELPAPKKRK